MKVIDYTVVKYTAVTGYLKNGWQLYGPPFEGNHYACQAMVKYDLNASTPKRRKALVRTDDNEIIKGWVIKFGCETDQEHGKVVNSMAALFEDLNGKLSTVCPMYVQFYEWEL